MASTRRTEVGTGGLWQAADRRVGENRCRVLSSAPGTGRNLQPGDESLEWWQRCKCRRPRRADLDDVQRLVRYLLRRSTVPRDRAIAFRENAGRHGVSRNHSLSTKCLSRPTVDTGTLSLRGGRRG